MKTAHSLNESLALSSSGPRILLACLPDVGEVALQRVLDPGLAEASLRKEKGRL